MLASLGHDDALLAVAAIQWHDSQAMHLNLRSQFVRE
jgi:hypothetical protein